MLLVMQYKSVQKMWTYFMTWAGFDPTI